jgi:transitional endoplasmic reticulum ATPase
MSEIAKKGTSLNETGPVASVAEVKYHDGPLLLPNGMSITEARALLRRRQEYLEEEVTVASNYDAFPWDGANALEQVLIKKFGWAPATATPGFFGPTPPKMITIEVGPGKVKQVPWGSFSLPGVEGLLNTGVAQKAGRFLFALNATVKRKDEATIKDIYTMVREYLKDGSIYRGQAIKIRFLDDDGKPLAMPDPTFMDTSHIQREMLIYSKHIEDAVETNLFTPISRVQDTLDNGLPVKRAVLLGGTYGTGKTLAATVASKIAVDNGITYVYVPRADELPQAIEFAKLYQSPACVLFCEDVDRVTSGERNVKMDDLLNIVDGIDTKNHHLITVFTTNDLDSINPAMIRPGRLDCVIEVMAPDAEAVQRLLRAYGGKSIAEGTDLTMAGKALEGSIPAVIAEVLKRAKLSQLKFTPKGQKIGELEEDAIIEAAVTMKGQLDLLDRLIDKNAIKPIPTLDLALSTMVSNAIDPLAKKIDTVIENQ